MKKLAIFTFIFTIIVSGTAIAETNKTSKANNYPTYAEAEQQAKVTHSKRIYQLDYDEENLWSRISLELQLPHYAKLPEVQRQIKWFKQHKKFLNSIGEHGNPYLYYIYTEVERRKLPGELILLPMIESAYDPFAHSWVGAAGLWQFMPETASGYGVKQNWWYDGRRDVIQSTQAALTHLNDLYKYFNGNWLLAIASYNSGAGTVQKAIRYNTKNGKSTDFWSLPLPDETKAYVPRLLALAAIISDPYAYGFKLPKMPAKPYFAEVDIGRQMDLSKAANMAGISLNQLYQLNPGYSRWTTAPDGPHTLLIPVEKVNHFEKNVKDKTGKPVKKITLAEAPKKSIPRDSLMQDLNIVKYTIKSGDTLWDIAKAYHVKVDDLRAWNHLRNNNLIAGKQLVIWQGTPTTQYTYAVRKGDSLSKIAHRNKITVAQLKQANNLNSSVIFAGQKLTIPLKGDTTFAENKSKKGKTKEIDPTLVPTLAYKVKPGDSLSTIAFRHRVDINQIKQANALASSTIHQGQTLYIPTHNSQIG